MQDQVIDADGEVRDLAVMPPQNNSASLSIIANAVSRGMGADELGKLVDLHERIEKMRAQREYQQAMTACQHEMPAIFKDKENPHTRSRYADLGSLLRQIGPIYTKHGFSLSFSDGPPPREGWIQIVCDIMHEGGHREVKTRSLPLDGVGSQGGRSAMSPVQSIGSTLSYGRRYLVGDIFNLAITSEDNDGNRPRNKPEPELPPCKPAHLCADAAELTASWKAVPKDLQQASGPAFLRRADELNLEWDGKGYVPKSEVSYGQRYDAWAVKLADLDSEIADGRVDDLPDVLSVILTEIRAMPKDDKDVKPIWNKLVVPFAAKHGYFIDQASKKFAKKT